MKIFSNAVICLLLSLFLFSCKENKPVVKTKTTMTLTYIMDPQCGWCYGNSENISQLKKEFSHKFNFEILVGGMWLNEDAPKGGEELSGFLQTHAPRMAQTTGAKVGQEYYSLAQDSSYAFSSLEPSTAMVLVKSMAPEKTFDFAKSVQKSLLLEGNRLDKLETYLPILKSLSIDKKQFESEWMTKENLKMTHQEFNKAGQLANGFPTLILKTKEGQKVLASGYFDLKEMKENLSKL